METIDLYQVHRFDPDTPIDEMLSALDLLVRQGKVRYIGASSTAAWKFAQALSLSERHGWARFVTMQNHYNLLYREEEREMIPLCEAEGVAVIPWSPLARGLLAGTRKSPADAESTTRAGSDDFARKLYDQPSDQEVIDAVRQVAQARGVPPARVALAWLLSKPAVTAPIIGATKLQASRRRHRRPRPAIERPKKSVGSKLLPAASRTRLCMTRRNAVRSEERGVRREDWPRRLLFASPTPPPPSSLGLRSLRRHAGLAATATSPPSVAGMPRGSLTTSTEQEASRSTRSATLPISSRSRPVLPCVPMTIRSTAASRP